MNQVKIGLIGLGRWGNLQLCALSTLPYVKVVAVSSRSEERCKEICNRYGIGKYYLNFKDLTNDSEIQAVIVSTEGERHFEPALAALDAEKDVLVEKPLALTLEGIDKVIEQARKKKVIFMVGHILRFDLRYVMLKERIKRGELGQVVSIYSRRNVWRGLFDAHAKYTPMLETGVHEIDLARWYMEDEVKKVYAKKANILNPEIPDTYWVILTFAKGGISVIETSWLLPSATPNEMDATVEVVGSKGVAFIHSPSNTISIYTQNKTEFPDVFGWPIVDEYVEGAIKRKLDYFARCVLNKTPQTKVLFEDARESVRIALAAIKSAREDREIIL
ncbi:Gfo/Idh/MocA family oxidoreductase [Patescibacteria group bacterium]|nr:Gfo/Idh/MocA family oxidoreductase [Patescibacteria group bacterium]